MYIAMTLEEFLVITGVIFLVIAQLVMMWCKKNTYLKYKEQKVGVRTKWWRK
jgi:hypothetical protein